MILINNVSKVEIIPSTNITPVMFIDSERTKYPITTEANTIFEISEKYRDNVSSWSKFKFIQLHYSIITLLNNSPCILYLTPDPFPCNGEGRNSTPPVRDKGQHQMVAVLELLPVSPPANCLELAPPSWLALASKWSAQTNRRV